MKANQRGFNSSRLLFQCGMVTIALSIGLAIAGAIAITSENLRRWDVVNKEPYLSFWDNFEEETRTKFFPAKADREAYVDKMMALKKQQLDEKRQRQIVAWKSQQGVFIVLYFCCVLVGVVGTGVGVMMIRSSGKT